MPFISRRVLIVLLALTTAALAINIYFNIASANYIHELTLSCHP